MPYTIENTQPSQTILISRIQAMTARAALEFLGGRATTRELISYGIIDPACDIEMLRLMGYEVLIEFITTAYSEGLVNTIQYKLLKPYTLAKQEDIVLNLLQGFHRVSTDELKSLGIRCPSAVISKLRNKGVSIKLIYHRDNSSVVTNTRGQYRYMLQDVTRGEEL